MRGPQARGIQNGWGKRGNVMGVGVAGFGMVLHWRGFKK
jgi:hypothetical protein